MSQFDLKVGFSCNNDCMHCVITDKKHAGNMSTEAIKKIISLRSPEEGIVFTGGEPTIRKDFVELVKFAKERGHSTSLQTNGSMLGNIELARSIKPYIDHVLIAIHSCDEETHNEIVRSEGMWKRTIQGLRNLVELGIPHGTQTVISKLNISNIIGTFNMIQEISPNCKMNFTFPHPNGNAYKNKDIVVPKYSEIAEQIHEALVKFPNLLLTEAIPFCYLYPYQDNVYYNLDENLFFGNDIRKGIDISNTENEFFNEHGITEDYNNSMLSEKMKGPKCVECIFDDRCPGVWKEYVEFYGKEFDLFPIKKEIKKKKEFKNGALIIYSENKCMNTCVFCEGGPDTLSVEKRFNNTISDLEYLAETGVTDLEISGGDPGEYPLIDGIVKYARGLGIERIQLSTHGRTLKDESLVIALKEAGLTSVKLPMYGSVANIHNKSTQVRDSFGNAFEDTVQAILNCKKHGIPIRGWIVPNNYNKHDLANIIKLYLDLACDMMEEIYIGTAFISIKDLSYTGDWFLPLKDIEKYIKPVLDYYKNIPKRIRFRILDIPYCALGGYTFVAENEKDNYPNLGKHKVEENNRSTESDYVPHYRIKDYFGECDSCMYKPICGGITRNELEMFGYGDLKGFKEEICLDLQI